MIAGDLRPMPITAVINPRVTARLYAGAVDATPMTMLDSSPMAFDLSPLSGSSATPPAACCCGVTGFGGGTAAAEPSMTASLTVRRSVLRKPS